MKKMSVVILSILSFYLSGCFHSSYDADYNYIDDDVFEYDLRMDFDYHCYGTLIVKNTGSKIASGMVNASVYIYDEENNQIAKENAQVKGIVFPGKTAESGDFIFSDSEKSPASEICAANKFIINASPDFIEYDASK